MDVTFNGLADGLGIATLPDFAYLLGSGTNLRTKSNGIALEATSSVLCARRTDSFSGVDHYAEITVGVAPLSGEFLGIAVRCQESGNFYGCYCSDGTVYLYYWNGTFNTLDSRASTLIAGTVLRLTPTWTGVTNNLVVTRNGSTTGMPSASHASLQGGTPGISGFCSTTSPSTGTITTFSFTDPDAELPLDGYYRSAMTAMSAMTSGGRL